MDDVDAAQNEANRFIQMVDDESPMHDLRLALSLLTIPADRALADLIREALAVSQAETS